MYTEGCFTFDELCNGITLSQMCILSTRGVTVLILNRIMTQN